jgi:endonuclease-3 related protein
MQKNNILKIYEILSEEFGNLNWWPIDIKYHQQNETDPRFEIMVGAILTQNTAWSNVEKALDNLKQTKVLDIKSISKLPIKKLRTLIKPSGFFNQKADRLKNLAKFLEIKYNSDLNKFLNRDITTIREELLSLNGIGPETADSIILYAGNMPIFVVDAYTKRLCKRLPINIENDYQKIQKYFQDKLLKTIPEKESVKIYNELHSQIVILAKNYCKTKPLCVNCPLKNICKYKK